ncbi:hypothetical protein IQ235_13715 [Oscillatoriales cyanobacterium LEGE 11467]|uniref:Tetratricopeptide repeat protein n=1 Tax=Zarconia navalis LEGE 11467 TaxID=1828826 RepID=A0A928VYY2_9CYAN|nr:hypothetical protein [Zarconia navalis]MBE9041838.1 hypothetical protein [Zarconia navalis LEGE 11467]
MSVGSLIFSRLKKIETIFEEADKLLDRASHEEAFLAFKEIAQNQILEKSIRAEAYNMMGVIIAEPAPDLSKNEDESGLEYFKAALELDENNLGAALNILEGYRTSPTGHSDRESVKLACSLLENHHWDEISEFDRQLVIENRRKLL